MGNCLLLAQLVTLERNSIFSGLVVGAMIGVLAAGIVLVYRSSRVINFAYGEVGVFGAMLLALLVLEYGWNFWICLPLAVAAGGLLSLTIELTVVRRLFDAPRVIVFVATLGVALVVRVAILALPDISADKAASFPTPFFVRPSRANPDAVYDLFGFSIPFELFGIGVGGREVMALVMVPVVMIGLAYFMNRTLYGLCVQAAAGNADAARLAGVSPKRMSSIVWTIAGMLAVLTVILLMPLLALSPGPVVEVVGPTLLLRALVAALAARMKSLPVAFGAGLVIGVTEQVVRLSVRADRALLNGPGVFFLLLFAAVLVLVVFVAGRVTRAESGGTFSFAPKVKPVPKHLQNHPLMRFLPQLLAAVAVASALVLPWVMGVARLERVAAVFTVALIGLSVTVLTGWAGQLSLGQFSIAGLGAFTTASLSGRGIPWFGGRLFDGGLPFWWAVVLAVVVSVGIAMLVGAPALRVQGLFLAVTTFAFAVVCDQWLFSRDVLIPSGQQSVPVDRGSIGPVDITSSRSYYFACLAILVIAAFLVARLRRSGIGRSLIAVRDNEDSAAAFTISPQRAKLMAFGVSGALAGLAGALAAGLNRNVNAADYGVTASLDVVAMTIVGGVGSVAGPLLGALWVEGLPVFTSPSEQVNFLRGGIGLLIILMYFPGGMVQIGYAIRDAIVRWLDARTEKPEVGPIERAAIPALGAAARTIEGPAVRTTGLSVAFGANRAVNDVSITAMPGEVVGLIGGNGAGKSTLMNAIGGFVPSTGGVELFGDSIATLSPHLRSRRGLGRTFQSAELFGALTVRETVMVALEARHRTTLPATLLGGPVHNGRERVKRADADALVDFVGLGRYADSFISELSTGTRRICELACLLALDAQVLCLDEPTAGVAQRETEAFGPLIKRIQAELGATLIVIEHDMPLIMSISDRVYCLEAGELIAEGEPDQVRNDPRVIASYLGTDERAIERSG